MKPIAFYLPQFYSFKENDEWWGKGFTEWTNVKKSKPLFPGHYQPTVPLNDNYYSLEDVDTMRWQVEIAKEYGLYGFCFYHYWFGEGRQLMEKPVEAYLEHSDIGFPFCLCWANHNWSRTWVGGDQDILMDMKYGREREWENHFQYLDQYFSDERYIKVENKPLLVIYTSEGFSEIRDMCSFFRAQAVRHGYDGILIALQNYPYKRMDVLQSVDYYIEYEPNFALSEFARRPFATTLVAPRFGADMFSHYVKRAVQRVLDHKRSALPYSYDAIWGYILRHRPRNEKCIAGVFCRCDVSPRRQERALIYVGDTPQKFKQYMCRMSQKISEQYSTDFVFVSAWNEWGEGMYLEPDERNGYGYLEGIRDAVK